MLKSKDTNKLRDEVKQISEALAAKTAKSGKISVGTRLPPDVHKRVKVLGAKTGKTVSEILEHALESYLEKNNA